MKTQMNETLYNLIHIIIYDFMTENILFSPLILHFRDLLPHCDYIIPKNRLHLALIR